ncbi:MAG TPA: FeoB small GTPase domain-containing protein, partial [Candidatus Hydrogenedentes bacterium]|nr:FeoB small GTPase domain-containing protein [Candidatus Hydrogenedentota bacterium]
MAIAGNPNAGKTSLFNAITGASRHVGNYPGVTVEIKEGRARGSQIPFNAVDLPGCYGLTAYSQEEWVARDFLLCHRPDLIINVVDASNLERNLYLTVQLLELKQPVVIALNMVDAAEKRGIRINHKSLERLLGVPVVPTVATKGVGIDELLETCGKVLDGATRVTPQAVRYGHPVDELVMDLTGPLTPVGEVEPKLPAEWIAVKLLENDPATWKRLKEFGDPDLTRKVEHALK